MRTGYIIAIVAAMASCVACQKNNFDTEYAGGESIVRFVPSMAEVSYADGLTKSAAASADQSGLSLSATDGSFTLPMTCETSVGINLGGVSSQTSDGVATKGTLHNETGSDVSLGKYVDYFMVAAWNIPSSGDPVKVIPDGSASAFGSDYVSDGYQKVMKRTASDDSEYWMTVQPQTATVEGAPEKADDEYIWESGETKTFYAYANLPESGTTMALLSKGAGQTMEYTVPATASAQTDIMMGFYNGTGGGTGTAGIEFEHPLTAVKFLYGEIDDNPVIKSITLKGVAASGTAKMNSTGSISWEVAGFDFTVKQEDASGLSVDTGSKLIGEPFILIPQDLESDNVTVTVVLGFEGREDVIVEAEINTDEWQAGETNTYKLGFNPYTLIVEGEVETDYQAEGSKSYSVISYAPWKLQYTTDGGSTWTDAVAGTSIGDWIKFDKVSGEASDNSQTVNATVSVATQTSFTADHSAALQSAAEKGTRESPYDLSMHTILGGERNSGKPVTANSYVVSASGWYAFPLVYGNAIDYEKVPTDGVNESAFKFSTTASGTDILKQFQCATGDISTPFISGISETSKAYPLWEDLPDYTIISNNTDDCFIVSSEEAQSLGLTLGGRCGYIVFHVNKRNLNQGNAVIAVTDGAASPKILWSWHIWVTDDDLTCKIVNNGESGTSNFNKGVLPFNLGWVDLSEITGYEGKILQIRFVQMAGDVVKNQVEKTAKRNENIISLVPKGQSPTYQWGRKDPLIRVKYSGTSTAELGVGERSGSFIQTVSTKVDIAYTINNPTCFPTSKNVPYKVNLWSADNTSNGTTAKGYSSAPIKTVYDPCPPGFQVPQVNAFSRFKLETMVGEFNYGMNFSISEGSTVSVFFPAMGYRNFSDGGHINAKGAIWLLSAVPKSSNTPYAWYAWYSPTSKTLEYNHSGDSALGTPVRPVVE